MTDARLFKTLALIGAMLPADPDRGVPCLVALALVGLGVLIFACIRVPWLFPSLLLVLGGLAESYILAVVGLPESGEAWVPILGFGGVVLGAMQVRRVTGTRPFQPVPRDHSLAR